MISKQLCILVLYLFQLMDMFVLTEIYHNTFPVLVWFATSSYIQHIYNAFQMIKETHVEILLHEIQGKYTHASFGIYDHSPVEEDIQ